MSIGKWFEKAGKDVGKFISKEVPKFFNETIPSVGKPETYRPSLIGLRKTKKSLESRLADERSAFFSDRSTLTEKTARYRAMSEDYKRRFGEAAADTKIKVIEDKQWDEPVNKTAKVLRDVDTSVRTVFGSATLGISEVMWAPKAAILAKQEKQFLEKHNRALHQVVKQVQSARNKIAAAGRDLDASIAALRAQDASIAEIAGERNQNTLDDARTDAVTSLARNMLEDGAMPEQVALLTGLSAEQVASLISNAEQEV